MKLSPLLRALPKFLAGFGPSREHPAAEDLRDAPLDSYHSSHSSALDQTARTGSKNGIRRAAFGLLLIPCASAQFSEPSFLPGDAAIGTSAGQQEKPAVASGAGHSLAVWQEQKSGLGGFVAPPSGLFPNKDVYAVLLDAQGEPAWDAPLVVNEDPWDQEHIRVAWNGTNYLVVWETTRTTTIWKTLGIYAARVDPSGALLDDPPILIEDKDDFDERFPVVASDGSGWLVVYTDNFGSTGQRTGGAYVDASGLVLMKKTLVPNSSPQSVNYEASFAGNRFAFIYERNYSGPIAVRLYDSALNQVGGEITLASNGVRPGIGSNGSGFYVAWLQGGARGTPLSTTGSIGVPGGVQLNGSFSLGDPEVAVAWDGSEWFAFFDGYSAVYGAQVDAGGALVAGSPFVVEDNLSYVNDPACANGNGHAIALYTNWRNTGQFNVDPFDIHARRVTPGAQVSPVFAITVSPPAQVFPAIAGDPVNGYLVAFHSRSSGVARVVAQRFSGAGEPIDLEPIELAIGDSTISGILDVAWDGSEWLVAWYKLISGPPYLYHTFARRVNLDGSLPDAGPFYLQRGTRPTIAAVNGVFLVTSHWHYPPVQSNEIYHATRVRGADGAILDSSEIPIDFGSGRSDSVAFDDRWLVVWGGVAGAFVFPNGSVSAPFYAADTGGGSVDLSLARNGDEALLVFQYNASLSWNADIRARRIKKDGTLLDLFTGSFVSSANNGQLLPAATWYGSKYLVTFTDYRDHIPLEPAIGDVYGVRVAGDNTILDVPELPILNGWPRAEGRTAVAGGAERVLIVSSVLAGGTFGNWRLSLQKLVESQIGLNYCTPAVVNSSGFSAQISALGSTEVCQNDLRLEAVNLPANKVGLFLASPNQANIPFIGGGQGTLCLGTPIARFFGDLQNSGPGGSFDLQVDLTAIPYPNPRVVLPGETWNFQAWFRDNNPMPTTNLTDGISIMFQ